MKKKVLAALLCASMTATLFAGCKDKEEPAANTETPATEAASTEEAAPAEEGTAPTLADPEELPEAFAHITFDGEDEGYTTVTQTENVGENDGATFGVEPTEGTVLYAAGPVGQAAYLDGSFGLDLGLEPTNTDAYTVSFWVNADRLSTFGPTLTMGYDIGKASDAGNDVTWMNVTQSEWGADSAKIFPIVWSRNEASDSADGIDCWPWMYSFDNEIHGKREWAMVTIVCSGEEQAGPTGATTAGAQFYVNGIKTYDSQDNFENGTYFEYTWDASLAPNIMKPGDKTFESYFGINYWDTVFKGFVDDLYVFDSALTPGQVASLYLLGDATVESVVEGAGEATDDAEPVAADHSDVATTGTVVGATDCSTAFWGAHSETWEVAEGESVSKTFKNYSSTLNNWNNFVVVLQNVADAHSADDNAEYAEYGVVRADNYGWGAGYDNIATAECDYNWDTFTTDLDRSDVTVTVTNNGSTADVVAEVTTAEGKTYTQKYTGIAIDGDLHFCLTVDGCFLDIQ